jgi:acyl-CoA thioesterase
MADATKSAPSAQQIAEAVGAGMLAKDRASRGLGMALLAIGPGSARLSMTVRGDMLNGFQICHGGFVTLLADSAFAFACNSYNELTVASGLNIDFTAASHEGDLLTASATEVHQSGRMGVYNIEVHNQRAELVASMRGRSYRLKGKPVVVLDDTASGA